MSQELGIKYTKSGGEMKMNSRKLFTTKKAVVFLLICFMITLIGCSDNGGEEPDDGYLEIEINNGEGTITNYDVETAKEELGEEDALNFIIPSEEAGVEITVIGEEAFSGKGLTAVNFSGDNVEKINDGAFSNNKLTLVEIPDSVIEIGEGVFSNNELESLKISEGIIKISSAAFIGNELKSVEISDSVKEIGGSAFNDNELTSVEIPAGVEEIGKFAFWQNENLEEVNMPAEVNLKGDIISTGAFKEVYEENDEEAGTYKLINDEWVLEE